MKGQQLYFLYAERRGAIRIFLGLQSSKVYIHQNLLKVVVHVIIIYQLNQNAC